jgi:hypothetical protein
VVWHGWARSGEAWCGWARRGAAVFGTAGLGWVWRGLITSARKGFFGGPFLCLHPAYLCSTQVFRSSASLSQQRISAAAGRLDRRFWPQDALFSRFETVRSFRTGLVRLLPEE